MESNKKIQQQNILSFDIGKIHLSLCQFTLFFDLKDKKNFQICLKKWSV